MIDGATTIAEFNAKHDGALEDRDYTTLGGYLFGHLGRLPRPGDRISAGGFNFEIVAMDGRRVKTVRAEALVRSPK